MLITIEILFCFNWLIVLLYFFIQLNFLVPISDFSQGRAGKIFSDVAVNNHEHIVLKNNQPTAVLLSVKEYRDTQEKVEMSL